MSHAVCITYRFAESRLAIVTAASILLCTPSMNENQKGFKSPVYRMNMKMERTIRSQLREGDRPWGGRLGESHQPMNKNLIGGRRNGTSWHNTAKFLHSVSEVNGAVGWRRFSFLSGEISSASVGEKSAEIIVVITKPGAGGCSIKQRYRNSL